MQVRPIERITLSGNKNHVFKLNYFKSSTTSDKLVYRTQKTSLFLKFYHRFQMQNSLVHGRNNMDLNVSTSPYDANFIYHIA